MPRVFAISDLHVDYGANRVLVEAVSEHDYQDDALIVAGDVCEDLSLLADTLTRLRRSFARLFYLPGNHDLWVRHETYDSWEKLARIFALCANLGVETEPADCGDVRIVPVQSWYDADFIPGLIPEPRLLAMWSDFRRCRWGEVTDLAARMAERSRIEPAVPPQRVVSFSHFLPRPELVPPVEVLFYKALGAVSGSRHIETQLRAAGSSVHIYGHTHINRTVELAGVRYIQNALGYPRERQGELKELPILSVISDE